MNRLTALIAVVYRLFDYYWYGSMPVLPITNKHRSPLSSPPSSPTGDDAYTVFNSNTNYSKRFVRHRISDTDEPSNPTAYDRLSNLAEHGRVDPRLYIDMRALLGVGRKEV